MNISYFKKILEKERYTPFLDTFSGPTKKGKDRTTIWRTIKDSGKSRGQFSGKDMYVNPV